MRAAKGVAAARALLVAAVAWGLAACVSVDGPGPHAPQAAAPAPPSLAPAPPPAAPEPAPAPAPAASPAADALASLPPDHEPVLALARTVLEAQAPDWDPLDREGVARVLARAERERGLPVLLLVALIDRESRFDPDAVGPRGARGLMQIKPFVGRDVARRHGLPFERGRTLFDPIANVRLGVRYLGELRERFGTAELALAAYNMGPTRLARRLRHGGSVRGRYVGGLLERWSALRREFGTTETGIGG